MAVTDVRAVAMAIPDDDAPVRHRAWLRRLQIVAPLTLIALIFFACFVLPLVAPIPKPTGGDILDSLKPAFSPGHFLGTDDNGNDILSRVVAHSPSSSGLGLRTAARYVVRGRVFRSPSSE